MRLHLITSMSSKAIYFVKTATAAHLLANRHLCLVKKNLGVTLVFL
jgi:hypothetical protein